MSEASSSKKRKATMALSSTSSSAETSSSEGVSYYLMKSEPHVFSLSSLESSPKQTSLWDGVRNYQARNILSGMKLGDKAFFYHSNAKKETGIVGVVEVTREGYPDPTAVDPASEYFDAKIKDGDNKWVSVDVTLRTRFSKPVLLTELKGVQELQEMQLFKSSRLSVSRVTKEEWQVICKLAGENPLW